jgi:outer membrane protein assembly factor BamB
MNVRLCGFLGAVALAWNGFAAALEWPEFRGPTGQGISEARNVPVSWSTTSNVVWKTAVPEGWSSPVISKGKVYLTGATNMGDGVSLRALCLDLESGKVVWDVEAIRTENEAARVKHSKNGLASPTPIVRDGKLYVHFGHMGTAALDLDGKVLWKQTSIKYHPVHGAGGSPALVDGLLVFSCDGSNDPFLAALDAGTGEIKWKTARNTPAKSQFSFSTPLVVTVDGAEQLISPFSGFVAGYEPKTGKEIWRSSYGEGYSVIPRPVFAHGLLFVSSGYDHPVIYAVDPKGAKGDVTDSAIKWQEAKGAPNTPSMLAVGDELYVVSDAGIATCFDAKTGKAHWSERLGGGFSASPVVAEGRIYFLNEAGVGFVLKASKSFELLAKNELGERTLASPAVLDGMILIRSAGHLWRIGVK